MKTTEIRERTDHELERLAGQIKEDLYRLRVKKATNQLEDTATLRRVSRDLARVLTVRHARNLRIEQGKADAE